MNMNNQPVGENQRAARAIAAETRLRKELHDNAIPYADAIVNFIVVDLINNLTNTPEEINAEVNAWTWETMKDMFEYEDISQNQYLILRDAFKDFVKSYHGVAGGKRRSKRRQTRKSKKTRKQKKTRKH